MKIVRMIADLMLIESQLRVAMRINTTSEARVSLLRISAELMDRIERHHPESVAELHEMIAFFTRRATILGSPDNEGRDMELAVQLMDKYKSDWLPDQSQPVDDDTLAYQMDDPRDDRLATYVSRSQERLVAIAPDYRYLATSRSNAEFNGTTQVGLLGQHLLDVVGPARFYERGKPKLDACFGGEIQEYHYALNVPDKGDRIIRCQMKPVGGGPSEVRYCSLMYMRDVTDIATGLTKPVVLPGL